MKKLLFALLIMLIASYINATANDKQTIGIFIEAPTIITNNETFQKLVLDKTKSLFPTNGFTVLPLETTTRQLKLYKEDHRMVINQYVSKPVNSEDIQSIAKPLGCNYALFIVASNDPPRISPRLFSVSFKTTASCDVRLLDIETGKYLTNKEVFQEGSGNSLGKTYNEALEKALSQFKYDASLLVKPIETVL